MLHGRPRKWAPGLVNLVCTVAYNFCLNLPEKLSQPGTHFLAQLWRMIWGKDRAPFSFVSAFAPEFGLNERRQSFAGGETPRAASERRRRPKIYNWRVKWSPINRVGTSPKLLERAAESIRRIRKSERGQRARREKRQLSRIRERRFACSE